MEKVNARVSRKTTVHILACLLAASLSAAPVSATVVDGFLEAAGPLDLSGDVSVFLADPVVHLQNPAGGAPSAPIVLFARDVELVRVTRDLTRAEAGEDIGNVILPGDDEARERHTFSNATIELSAIREDADILFFPTDANPLLLSATGQPHLKIGLRDELRVLDGHQRRNGEVRQGEPHPFHWAYTAEGPLINASGLNSLELGGAAAGYVWSAHILVRDETGRALTFDTGFRTNAGPAEVVHQDHYEYVLFQLDGLHSVLEPGALTTSVVGPALRVGLHGTALLPGAHGTLTGEESIFRARTPSLLEVTGNLTLDVTPRGTGSMTIGLAGDLITTNLLVRTDESGLLSGRIVAVSAGGATVLGLAAWYILSANGLLLAAPALRRRTEEPNEQPIRPGELLFDSDRFTLYHLIEAQAGLGAEECARITGIQDAAQHLERLAEGGLLVPISEGPVRYALPGSLSERRAQRIIFLREDVRAFQLARLLAVHGLTPQARLVARAAKVGPDLRAKTVTTLVDRFVALGLALREPGEEGPVLDPTDELYACLAAMGHRPSAVSP